MKFLSNLLAFLIALFDRLPSREEGLKNDIQKVKDEIIELQKKGKWTISDSNHYELLDNRLSELEKRLANLKG